MKTVKVWTFSFAFLEDNSKHFISRVASLISRPIWDGKIIPSHLNRVLNPFGFRDLQVKFKEPAKRSCFGPSENYELSLWPCLSNPLFFGLSPWFDLHLTEVNMTSKIHNLSFSFHLCFHSFFVLFFVWFVCFFVSFFGLFFVLFFILIAPPSLLSCPAPLSVFACHEVSWLLLLEPENIRG